MRLLLDTNILLWLGADSPRLAEPARALITHPETAALFSVVSLWEIGIKMQLGRADFAADPHRLRQGLLDAGYLELDLTGRHALAVGDLPPLHRDPFDRIMLAQARHEGAILMTSDRMLARYPVPVHLV